MSNYTPPTSRPPPQLGSIPPQMMQPPYGYSPLIPPPMMSSRPPMIAPLDQKKSLGERAPSTTVFVGNISDRAPDVMMRQMLQRCGNVLNWKRVQGTNGKLQGFGFCEYDNPDATLRCIRLLNGYEISDKKILVKVDQKTRELLSEHIKTTRLNDKSQMTKNAKKAVQLRNKKSYNEPEDDKCDLNLELVDENTLKEDRIVISSFECILKQYAKDLIPIEPQIQEAPTPEIPQQAPVEEAKEEPIEDKEKDKDKEKSRLIEREREREPTRQRSPANDRHSRPSHHHNSSQDNDMSRSPSDSKPRPKRRATPPAEEPPSRGGSQARNGHGNGHGNGRNDDSHSYSQKESRSAIQEETEEMRERKRLERKLREKEMAYRDRLKAWEAREQRKRHDYSIEKNKEVQRHRLLVKEAKKLKQFLEDYDDLKDDPVFYKGLNLEKKLRLREKEIELDNKDRQREREELDELKRKLIEKGHTVDPDAEAKRIQNDENLRMKKKFEKLDESSSSSSSDEETTPQVEPQPVNSNLSDLNPNKEIIKEPEPDLDTNTKCTDTDESSNLQLEDMTKETIITAIVEAQSSMERHIDSYMTDDENSMSNLIDSPMKLENSPGESNSPIFSGSQNNNSQSLTHSVTIKSVGFIKKTIQPKNQIFAEEEDDQSGAQAAKKARLMAGMNSDERKRAVKKLVESIPTDRDELFAYPIDWEQLDQGLMDKRIKPWINKKIIEYIGEEEESLNDFICAKIKQHAKPDRLLEEVKVVLDEEAELFVKKMWRLIVYETESKRCGLSK